MFLEKFPYRVKFYTKHGIVARELLTPNQKTVLLSKNRLPISCYLTLFTFMRRSSTRRHMETKKVMMK